MFFEEISVTLAEEFSCIWKLSIIAEFYKKGVRFPGHSLFAYCQSGPVHRPGQHCRRDEAEEVNLRGTQWIKLTASHNQPLPLNRGWN